MTTRNYEAMFILENNAATADFDATAGKVDEILEKHGATLVQKEKWDERKLAYEISGQRRGTYYLVYFTADPSSVAGMYEDLHLTEVVLRHMFIALDVPIEEHIATFEVERERLAEDSRRSSLGWGGGGRRSGPRGPRKAREEGEAESAHAGETAEPETGGAPDGDAPDGDAPDGDAPDGDAPDGDAPDGDASETAPEAQAEAETEAATGDEPESDGSEEAPEEKEAASKP